MEAALIVGLLVVVMTAVAMWQGGPARAVDGYVKGWELALSVLPQVALGFALAGLIAVVVPPELIGRWIGEGSGLSGVVIATVGGILTPGGPFLQFPLVASLERGGAGIGPLAAYLTAWSLLGLNRTIVWEIPLLGNSFTLARWAVSIAVPIVVGVLMPPAIRLLSR
jgi:uncharacterized membrane protein YraQ (UPF0718 family)